MPKLVEAPSGPSSRARLSGPKAARRPPSQPPSGHVFKAKRTRGDVWYAKYRLPDGRQVQRKIGPAWSERGRPPAGYYTKRLAEEWLRELLDQARRGTLPGLVRTGVSVKDAADEYMRYIEHDRERKPSTVKGYRWIVDSQILPALGHMQIEDVTTEDVEEWLANMRSHAKTRRGARQEERRVDPLAKPPTASSRRKALVILHGIFKRARKLHKLPFNPVAEVEKPPLSSSGDIQVFSPQEIHSLVRAAAGERDGAIYLTAAFTGLRLGELIALRWRDVDFPAKALRVRASYAVGRLTTPKSGKVRSVPLAPDVAQALTKLRGREYLAGDDDLVFLGEEGSYLDGSALRRRYKAALEAAGLRPLRFHDLRHTFGTRMIAKADIRRVQEWMGHADIQTTMRYLHYAPRAEDARLVAEAFAVQTPS